MDLASVPEGTQLSPFGVIRKSLPGKWRLIVDLSSPNGGSVFRVDDTPLQRKAKSPKTMVVSLRAK